MILDNNQNVLSNIHVMKCNNNSHLQFHPSFIEIQCQNWKFKINESKSIHITLTLNHDMYPQINDTNILIPTATTTKTWLFNKELTWADRTHNS